MYIYPIEYISKLKKNQFHLARKKPFLPCHVPGHSKGIYHWDPNVAAPNAKRPGRLCFSMFLTWGENEPLVLRSRMDIGLIYR